MVPAQDREEGLRAAVAEAAGGDVEGRELVDDRLEGEDLP